MSWRNIWHERETGRLRCWWRILAFLGVATLLTILFTIFLAFPLTAGPDVSPKVMSELMTMGILAVTIAVIFAGIWALRVFEGLPSQTLGLTFQGPWMISLLTGAVIGLTLIIILAGILLATGLATLQLHTMTEKEWQQLIGGAGILLSSAVTLAVILHGYIFQTLLRGVGPLIALAVTGLLGIGICFPNQQHPSAVPLANTLVMITLLGMVYLRSGSLWAPIGLNTGWMIGLLFLRLPIDGNRFPVKSPLSLEITAPNWIANATFGPEGGAIVSAILLAALAAVTYARVGLPLASYWWEWRELTTTRRQPPSWDFSIGTRHYQWKLLVGNQQK